MMEQVSIVKSAKFIVRTKRTIPNSIPAVCLCLTMSYSLRIARALVIKIMFVFLVIAAPRESLPAEVASRK